MLWIRFDEEDRRSAAPQFCLNSIQGERHCLEDLYEENNLVLVFIHNLSIPESRSLIQTFEEQEMEYREQGSKIYFIFQLQDGQTGNDGFLSRLNPEVRTRILIDPGGITRISYANLMSASLVKGEDTVIFVLDAYGAPYTAAIGEKFEGEELHREILSWLQYINIQCPE
jgi:hypothetical protein